MTTADAQSTSTANLDALADAVAEKLTSRAKDEVSQPTSTIIGAERFLSIKEVSAILGVTRQQIWKLTKKGKFRAYGRGTRMVRYKLSEIEAAMASL